MTLLMRTRSMMYSLCKLHILTMRSLVMGFLQFGIYCLDCNVGRSVDTFSNLLPHPGLVYTYFIVQVLTGFFYCSSRENYIKVDIFYRDLSYDFVKQQVSFEFLSLLSEIGGFMGLLLGARVLTVCELVDYLTLACLHRCMNHSYMKQDRYKC